MNSTSRAGASPNEHYDVIIIGTGAGGGTLAWRLAPSGKKILLIERGTYIPREKENWDTRAVVVDGRYNCGETWHDKNGGAFEPGTHYAVGGNTKFYGAALIRMRESDFGEVRHMDGLSPAWPISYSDLEPYYTRAEYLYHVHGRRGADPTEPPSSAPYRHPAISSEPRIREIWEGMERQGHHPFPMPVGILLDETTSSGSDSPTAARTSACIRCNTCDGFPCLVGAKADAQVICVDPALRHDNVTLLDNARAVRLETSASGREVTGVVVEKDGRLETYRASIVVSSCGAINSSALLLRSASDLHPGGLANRSGLVGRNYMSHVNTMFLAISRHRHETRFSKTLGLNDFYHAGEGREYPLGHISLMGSIDANVLRAGAPRIAPTMTLELMAEHAVPFWMTTEDLPDPNNRVTLGEDGSVVLSYTASNENAHRQLGRELRKILRSIEFEEHLVPLQAYIPGRIPLAGVAHQNGTLRFGADPATSVLNTDCRAHHVDNLYVVDGSFFPSSSAVNPALTIMANALRVGDHLLERLG
ncbi:MAG TPA: GMC family oxidoreductase [Candidatus Limnocylindrales bacterium]|nr:GMC family oxidoreductase [Candidatus Limnocylindrales bacterium]